MDEEPVSVIDIKTPTANPTLRAKCAATFTTQDTCVIEAQVRTCIANPLPLIDRRLSESGLRAIAASASAVDVREGQIKLLEEEAHLRTLSELVGLLKRGVLPQLVNLLGGERDKDGRVLFARFVLYAGLDDSYRRLTSRAAEIVLLHPQTLTATLATANAARPVAETDAPS